MKISINSKIPSSTIENGVYQNLEKTPMMTDDASYFKIFRKQFKAPKSVSPQNIIPSVTTDLKNFYSEKPAVIWFGHSSYLIHCRGINILVDPVFCGYASPFPFMMKAFEGLYRRDYIVIGGNYEGNDWVTSTGYFAGKMINDWLGMKANNRLVYIRVGEYHRIVDKKCVESYIFYDLPELMMALDVWPLSPSPGYSGHIPGPATLDGLVYQESDSSESNKTLKIVEEMLSKLNTPDKAWYPYWHENMLWYGPAGFGSYIGVKNFENFQVPFESCFQGWTVELSKNNTIIKDFARIADGHYATNGGWLSLHIDQENFCFIKILRKSKSSLHCHVAATLFHPTVKRLLLVGGEVRTIESGKWAS